MLSTLAAAALVAPSLYLSHNAAAWAQDSAESSAGMLSVALPEGIARAQLGDRDLAMLAVQVMLDRSRHSPGVIDGYGGGNTDRAIRSYRKAHGLGPGIAVDEELLRSLLETQSGDIFRTYTITEEDLNYNFTDVPSDFAAMAELEHLNYETPLEMFAERFHMDAEFLQALNPGVDFDTAGTTINIVSHGDERLGAEIARIEVRKSDGEVAALDAEGNLVATYPATIGSSQFPSPSGSMEVRVIAAKPNYTFNPEDQAWGPGRTLIIAPGPNNPVGGTWIDLGKEGYGIHGSPDPAKVGKRTSHGCVRLTNWDAAELAHAVASGMPVVFT